MEAVRKRISSVMGPWRHDVSWVGGVVKGVRGRGGSAYGDDIPPGRPLRPDLPDGRQADPVGPAAVDDEVTEQRAGEERGREEQHAERVPQRGRPEAEEVQRLKGRRSRAAGPPSPLAARAAEHHVRDARAGEA